MREGDLLMITADHGCDPSYTKTTDHTREYVPYLVCGKGVKPGVDLGTKLCFGTIAQTICEYLGVTPEEFFAAELADPVRLLSLSKSLRRLSSRQLELLEQLVQEMK